MKLFLFLLIMSGIIFADQSCIKAYSSKKMVNFYSRILKQDFTTAAPLTKEIANQLRTAMQKNEGPLYLKTKTIEFYGYFLKSNSQLEISFSILNVADSFNKQKEIDSFIKIKIGHRPTGLNVYAFRFLEGLLFTIKLMKKDDPQLKELILYADEVKNPFLQQILLGIGFGNNQTTITL